MNKTQQHSHQPTIEQHRSLFITNALRSIAFAQPEQQLAHAHKQQQQTQRLASRLAANWGVK